MSIAKLALVTAVILIGSRSFAQESPAGRESRGARGRGPVEAVELPGTPGWLADFEFEQESFTFVRLQYTSLRRNGRFQRGMWMTDYPDADLALAVQVGAMTQLDVSHPSKALKIVDPQLVASFPDNVHSERTGWETFPSKKAPPRDSAKLPDSVQRRRSGLPGSM